MKKHCALLFICLLPRLAMANDPAQAFKLLDDVFKKRAFKATFDYAVLSDNNDAQKAVLEGEIIVKDNMYCLKMDNQEVFCNGKTVWTYLIDSNEVQISKYDPTEESFNPWSIVNQYRKNYVAVSLITSKEAGNCYKIIKLISKNKDCPYPRIIIEVYPHNQHLKRMEVFEKNKTHHVFCIKSFDSKMLLKECLFNFYPEEHSEIEVIDLR